MSSYDIPPEGGIMESEIEREALRRRTAWMIERNSMWGTEWFCAGDDRWTKDPNKTIQFPDESSAKEIWCRMVGEEMKEFPYTKSMMEWDETISITEHVWI